ncbi:MAG: membrane protein insertase YidC [Bacteroidota bacterium]|jgi:YidC/Oxa1 family membrane protein insertase|nr:membrane protein insertase YidC [Bacteroidota bacterium]MEC7246731.1 membrane protein insertase YidC [Bacteroidota bacterium]MEC7286051.1 membrane protein insertase YidC [Bacteroidota bacterium]MEC7549129.1 membrane protein insertase YidC [Bacteroidota bacterium]MEC7829760.1 membrane protein insertase YidC [Bacteroidota bacterium]|tara:strand:- start:2609 stop:4402 length:1794 start_codon:yes stop_codon:yes gene_type:complete
MEEKRTSPLNIVGLLLMSILFVWYMYTFSPDEVSENQNNEVVSSEISSSKSNENLFVTEKNYNVEIYNDKEEKIINIENELISFDVTSHGGLIQNLLIKDELNYNKQPLYLVNGDNNKLNIIFTKKSGELIQSKFLKFDSEVNNSNISSEIILRAKISSNGNIDFKYVLPKDGYRFRFEIRINDVDQVLDKSVPIDFSWEMNSLRNSKSAQYEDRYTFMSYKNDKNKYNSLWYSESENLKEIFWISYTQHFFSSILIPNKPLIDNEISWKSISGDDIEDSKFLKFFKTDSKIFYDGNMFDLVFDWYMGPTDFSILKTYDENLEESISFGWGVFGWINKNIFFPLFGFLTNYFSHGIAIILLTIIIRLVISPVLYKSYVSQAKMRILRPDISKINERFKNDAVKRQQETMKMYSRAGASPLSGCLPAFFSSFLFIPLFYFFPIAFELRGKSFLWADDLSSYDVIANLPFTIPFYGNHISLFPLLASIAIFFYSRFTAGQQMQPSQPGMPNMKFIIYLMPVMLLFFFNNYSSGFSLYYFVSNLLMISIFLFIQNFIIDQDKILAKIEENRKKPKKQSRFQMKMEELMKKAEEQKRLRGK